MPISSISNETCDDNVVNFASLLSIILLKERMQQALQGFRSRDTPEVNEEGLVAPLNPKPAEHATIGA